MNRLKDGMCVVIGCGNASAPGSDVCHPTTCYENEFTLTDEEQEARDALRA
jgi:hypothetical protein